MVQIKPLVRAQTLKEMAYDRVKGLLRSGRMSGDTIYSANQLADSMGVSRTPVREALMQLSAEGFLTTLGSKGFQVRRFTPKEIDDTCEARQAIEVAVVTSLAARPEFDVKPLQAALDDMIRAARDGNPQKFMEADSEFHLYLTRSKGNGLLASMMENIRDRILLLGRQALAVEGRMEDVIAEHKAIVTELERRNPAGAGAAMARHLSATWRQVAAAHSGKAANARSSHTV